MSALLIAGSPSERSRSAALLDAVAQRLTVRGALVERVHVRDGVLRIGDASVDEIELRAPTGAIAGRIRMRAGEGRMPAVPSGIYAVRSAGSRSTLGFVTIL